MWLDHESFRPVRDGFGAVSLWTGSRGRTVVRVTRDKVTLVPVGV